MRNQDPTEHMRIYEDPTEHMRNQDPTEHMRNQDPTGCYIRAGHRLVLGIFSWVKDENWSKRLLYVFNDNSCQVKILQSTPKRRPGAGCNNLGKRPVA